jgi:hypothetical protein
MTNLKPDSSTITDVRKRLSKGISDLQTWQLQAINGTP